MPTAPSAIPYDQRHLWALSFDRVVCRTCDAELSDENRGSLQGRQEGAADRGVQAAAGRESVMATIKTKLTSGRTIGMNEGIVGLTMTGEFELFEGYDGRLRTEGQHNLSREERVDIADRMIKR